MKITRVDLCQLDMPLEKPRRYPNKTYEALDDTIVRIATDEGHVSRSEPSPEQYPLTIVPGFPGQRSRSKPVHGK